MKKYDWHELKSNMKIFAVIDTNVLVSALMSRHADSATVLIMDYISAGDIVPIYNEEILQEYYSVLSRDKFKFPKDPFVVTPAEMIHIVKTAKEIQTGLLNEPSGKYLSSNQQL